MTDEAIVRRFHKVVGVGHVNGPYDHGGNKPRWRWETSRLEHLAIMVEMLWPWLGARRRARAQELIIEENGHLTELGQAISRGKITAQEARRSS